MGLEPLHSGLGDNEPIVGQADYFPALRHLQISSVSYGCGFKLDFGESHMTLVNERARPVNFSGVLGVLRIKINANGVLNTRLRPGDESEAKSDRDQAGRALRGWLAGNSTL